ncbi:hypothetical protein IMW75_13455 [Pseudomonas gregormendelii]|uniref:Uncharacterized protein n=1 Tax=Pseudomonas gregormendelii TaxID=1628277 RepID=A0ABS3AGG2_9PSED|nr:hypothetical protein [Pseudomonas gregormendelii]MBN3966278.1 hypothetical protein [Pseudomonas gregormendelii]
MCSVTMPPNQREWIGEGETFGSRSDMAATLLDAYKEAIKKAEQSSRRSLLEQARSNPGAEIFNKALWDEAVAQTLERVLSLIVNGDRWEELHLPNPWL